MKIMIRALLAIVIVAMIFAAYAVATESATDEEVAAAKAFCVALVPALEKHRADQGRYPDEISSSWYEGQAPALVRLDDFYLAGPNGEWFLMRLRDPRVDPRFWFNDVYGWDSRKQAWEQYDGY